ncbi:hypothetical protein EYC84_003807 [Monilinia fructicola]|uniref:Uncharacterized protein n=1 Tax=Monilinia fructicola TaxID=38448 RepID=A0A5M9JYU2_MONFR|nr:hypothetical protein EYC84_003807 [Monilinia fructicola]
MIDSFYSSLPFMDTNTQSPDHNHDLSFWLENHNPFQPSVELFQFRLNIGGRVFLFNIVSRGHGVHIRPGGPTVQTANKPDLSSGIEPKSEAARNSSYTKLKLKIAYAWIFFIYDIVHICCGSR